jgi:hypothetical protein
VNTCFYRTVAVLYFCSSSAFAQHNQVGSDHSPLASNTNVLHAMFDLSPWFNGFEDSLRKQTKFSHFIGCLTDQLGQNQNISCKFKVNKNGEPKDLKIGSSSASSLLDAQLISLIQSADFSKVPNNLPMERGIEIEFWKADEKIYWWSRLDKATSSAKYELVDYLGAQEEHPWKTWKREMRYRNTSNQQLATAK